MIWKLLPSRRFQANLSPSKMLLRPRAQQSREARYLLNLSQLKRTRRSSHVKPRRRNVACAIISAQSSTSSSPDYATSDRGLEIREVAGGYRLATKPEYHDAVRGFVKSLKPPLKLSLQALETLAVVAYKQPVTAPEVSEIRGVDSGRACSDLS